MPSLRSRLTYSNVVSTLALFLALAGGTTAIALSGKNTVSSDDIKKGQVKSSDIGGSQVTNGDLAKDAVSGGKVKPETLFGADIGAGAVGTSELLDGSVEATDLAPTPAARVTGSIASVPANNQFTDAVFDNDSAGDAYDPAGLWNPAAPDRFTVPISGVYLATGSAFWPNDFTSGGTTFQDQGDRLIQISGSNGENQRSVMGPSRFGAEHTWQSAAVILNLDVGDRISFQVAQDNEDDSALAPVGVEMAAVWLGPSPGG